TFTGTYAYRWGGYKFRAGPMVALQITKYSVSVETLDQPTRSAVATDYTIGAPVLGIDFESRPSKKIDIYGFGGAIGWGSIGRVGLAEGGVKVFPIRHLALMGGVKYYNNVGKNQGDNLESRITYRIVGPFLGAGVWF